MRVRKSLYSLMLRGAIDPLVALDLLPVIPDQLDGDFPRVGALVSEGRRHEHRPHASRRRGEELPARRAIGVDQPGGDRSDQLGRTIDGRVSGIAGRDRHVARVVAPGRRPFTPIPRGAPSAARLRVRPIIPPLAAA